LYKALSEDKKAAHKVAKLEDIANMNDTAANAVAANTDFL
jgi:hypothetical protein